MKFLSRSLVDVVDVRSIQSHEPVLDREQLPRHFKRLVRSDAPEMDLMTVMCRERGYIERGGVEQKRGREWTR